MLIPVDRVVHERLELHVNLVQDLQGKQVTVKSINSNFILKQHYIIHMETIFLNVLLHGGHMAHDVPSSCDPKTKL